MIGEPETSLRDDLASAFDANDLPDTLPDTAPDVTPDAGLAPEAELAPLPALEAPAMWNAKFKESFGTLAGNPDQRAIAEAWLNQYKESQGYTTKKEQEFADLRKQFDPIRETLQPYEQYWQRQGMDTRQGLSQILGWGQALTSNPKETILELAKLYQVDLAEATAAQPYVDPAYQNLERQFQQVQQQLQQVQQYPQQQQRTQMLEQLKAFETATDEQGNPKNPHFTRVYDRMLGLARGGLVKDINDAYAKAVGMDDELQAELSQAKEQERAVARAAEAKKAAEASRTVKSKSGGTPAEPERGLRDDIAAQAAAMGFN